MYPVSKSYPFLSYRYRIELGVELDIQNVNLIGTGGTKLIQANVRSDSQPHFVFWWCRQPLLTNNAQVYEKSSWKPMVHTTCAYITGITFCTTKRRFHPMTVLSIHELAATALVNRQKHARNKQ